MSTRLYFRYWLYDLSKSGGDDSELAGEILKHTKASDAGLNGVKQGLYQAGVLDSLRDDLYRLEVAYRADLQAYYRSEQIKLAKALGVYSGNPLLHTKCESFDPNLLTATQLAKRLRIDTATINRQALKGNESFEKWTIIKFGEVWNFKMCEANYGLDTVRRFYRV